MADAGEEADIAKVHAKQLAAWREVPNPTHASIDQWNSDTHAGFAAKGGRIQRYGGKAAEALC